LRFIRRAQELGFALDDIRALLELSNSDCQQVQKLAAEKLSLVQEKLGQLRRIESVLEETLAQCAQREGNQPCPVIKSLTDSDRR
jgi:MerR family mercuric resistance operon transcriptional regulator